MGHVRIKANKSIPIDFHPKELEKTPVPKESIEFAKDYLKSKKLVADKEWDLLLMYEKEVVWGFDYLHQGDKRLLVEINPVTIFYANAVMSFNSLNHYRDELIKNSNKVDEVNSDAPFVNFTHTALFFQLAINCVINLQATLESFANRTIPENYPYLDRTGKPVAQTVSYKLYNAIPKIKTIDFKAAKHKKHNKCIEALIKLRNDIVHLKPSGKTNTGYIGVYRDLLNFDFVKAILSVKTFINFYEENLIEECPCGQEFCFYHGKIDDKDNSEAKEN